MSLQNSNEEDINEAFDKLLFAEEAAEEVGYKEGYEAGAARIIKGYHLGFHRAALVAARLGYYYGIVRYCLSSDSSNEKVKIQAQKLLADLENFPKNNDESVDILETFEAIKFKYIKLCSLAKIESSYPEADNLDY